MRPVNYNDIDLYFEPATMTVVTALDINPFVVVEQNPSAGSIPHSRSPALVECCTQTGVDVVDWRSLDR